MALEQGNRLQTVVAGRWNRHSSKHPQNQEFWRARNRYDAGKGSLNDVSVAADMVTLRLVQSLAEMGVDLVGDGGFMHDSIYDVTRRIEGCSGFKSLTRIPEVNHFHRQPTADLPLSREIPLLTEDLRFAQSATTRPVVVSLPGPYSTARQTQMEEKAFRH